MKKYIKIFLILIAFFIVTTPVTNILAVCEAGKICPPTSNGVDAATIISNSNDLDICPQCTTVWAAGSQAVRFTLVDKTDGHRIAGTISIDFSNQYYNTDFFNDVWFNGYNSKLEYLDGKAMTFNSNYSVQKPLGSMPNLVGDGGSKTTAMYDYLWNTFVIFDGRPTKLIQLFEKVQGTSSEVASFIEDINYLYDAFEDYNMKPEMSKEQWENLMNKYKFAFIVEPVIYLRARTGELEPTYFINSNKSAYYGKLFAVTPTEAAKIFPAEASSCKAGVCRDVTHSMLPNSIYLDGTVYDKYFSASAIRLQYSSILGFGDAETLKIFQTKNAKPYNIKYDVASNAGLGIGYFDLMNLVVKRCTDSCCGNLCDPEPEQTECEVTPVNKPDTPICKVGSCGTTLSFVDDLKWENINGDEDHIDSKLGTYDYLVTDWTKSTDILKYKPLSCNATRLSPVFCKQTVTSSFPVTPDSKFFAGTHFTFSPIQFDVKKDCYTEIELDVWELDYKETKERLEIAKESFYRATAMNLFWKSIQSSSYTRYDNPTNITPGIVKGSLSGGTYCSTEEREVSKFDATSTTIASCKYNGLEVQTGSNTVTSGDKRLTLINNSTCEYSEKVTMGLTEEGELIKYPVPIWEVRATPTVTVVKTSYCTYDGKTADFTVNDSETFGDMSVPDSIRISFVDGECTVRKSFGIGDKWNNWSYILDSIVLGASEEIGVIKATNGVSDGWEMTTEKYPALCKNGGDYQTMVVDKYDAAVKFYSKRLEELKLKLGDAMKEWEVTNKAPFVSSTHKQNTVAGQIQKTYNLSASGTDIYPSALTRIACTSDLCNRVKGLSGLPTIYASIYGSRETLYTYSLPSNTNRYILKPSGEVVSGLSGGYLASGNYLDIGYANYYIASNSVNGMGSGSITLNYSGLGQNNYFDKKCSYTSYSCGYTGVYEKGFDFVYRAIDLDNPFPYTDGTARQPGYNWRTDPTIINKVITNNRGVTTKDIYKQEPMYSFDFTGTNQKKLQLIKSYNKTHKFDEYDLTCIKGHSCTSNFLDTDMLKNVISGCGADGNVSSCYGGGN